MKTRGIRVKPQISQITQIEEGLGDHVLNSPVAKIHRDVTKVKRTCILSFNRRNL
jgi:hypothetical protein